MPDRIPSDWPPVIWVDTPEQLAEALEAWRAAGVIGVDTEANSFYAYHERLCLVQVSSAEQDWIVDPIGLGDEAIAQKLARFKQQECKI